MRELALLPRIAALHEIQSAYLEPRLRKIGINLSTFQLLAAVGAAGTEASQAEVARRLGVSPATLSESVQVHVKKGLLEQTVHPNDRRIRILRLTKSASEKLKDVRSVLSDLEAAIVQALGGSEVKATVAALDGAIQAGEAYLRR